MKHYISYSLADQDYI